MRFTRIITFIIAVALMSLAPALATSSASAAPTVSERAAAPSAERAGPKVGAKLIRKRGNFFLVGNVKPPRGPAIIQKATRCGNTAASCNWKGFRKVGVKKGRYVARVTVPARVGNEFFWRARVGASSSSVWITCKRPAGATGCPSGA